MAKKPASYLAGSVLLGTAIGAVVGLLAAPMAGRDMRGVLRRRATEAGEAGARRLKDVPRQLAGLPEAGQKLVASLPESGKRLAARVPGLLGRTSPPTEAEAEATSEGTAVSLEGPDERPNQPS